MDALLVLALGVNLWDIEPARAALGGDEASVISDAAAVHGAVQTKPLQQYAIQEVTGDGGMRIREFLNRDGTVFAVTWSGPVVPDLRRLLGTNFSIYTAALAGVPQRGLHRSLRITASGLIVETGGHMRAYIGRAYLPALVPVGTSTAELR